MILIRKRGKQQPEFFCNSMLANPWPAIDVDDWARHYAMAESVSKKNVLMIKQYGKMRNRKPSTPLPTTKLPLPPPPQFRKLFRLLSRIPNA